LLAAAKRAHKIDAGYRVPEEFRRNTPERLEEAFAAQRRAGLFSEFPFGTDLTREEIDLARALRWLKENTGNLRGRASMLACALLTRPREAEAPCLARQQLNDPRNFSARLNARLVSLGLRATAATNVAATSQTTATDP
jgi:hypothetical protein